jgi:glycosyltransferase involved in cell wall biosynthesis
MARPLRVLMIVENCPYPFDVRVRHEAETLAANSGYQVTVICPRGKNGGQKEKWRETINGVYAVRFPAPPNRGGMLGYLMEFGYATLAVTWLALWLTLRGKVDVIHVHNPPDTLWVAAVLPKLFGKKFIYDHHDLSPELFLSKYGEAAKTNRLYRILLWLEKRSCKMADWVVEVNESYKKGDIERNGVRPERVHVVRNGPNLKRMRLVPIDETLRGRAKTLIAYVGNISSQDGLDHLLGALYHLEHDLGEADWYCNIIGKADNLNELQGVAKELGISDRVRFTGFISDDEMLRILSTSDICIVPDPDNPLNNKSTMNKVMEYMALSKPMVAYDLVEHKFSAQGAALYAIPNDKLDMARQILKLIESPELRAEMGQIGKQRVDNELKWEYSAERLLKLYAEVSSAVLGAVHEQPATH